MRYVRIIYLDISGVGNEKYDGVNSVACFEYIEYLPKVVEKVTELLKPNGKICISISIEACFLMKIAVDAYKDAIKMDNVNAGIR